jgi:hypothetical protein
MPLVPLSDTTFEELKLLAEPFVDTPESLIAKIVHEAVLRRGALPRGDAAFNSAADGVLRLNPNSHESLAFTRLRSASVDGREMIRPKWNSFMDRVHVLGLSRLGSFEALKRATGARLRQGRYEDEGFKYLQDGDFSIQGLDSNGAWDQALSVARAIRVPIKVTVEWRDRAGAAHPGKTGLLEWTPAERGDRDEARHRRGSPGGH